MKLDNLNAIALNIMLDLAALFLFIGGITRYTAELTSHNVIMSQIGVVFLVIVAWRLGNHLDEMWRYMKGIR